MSFFRHPVWGSQKLAGKEEDKKTFYSLIDISSNPFISFVSNFTEQRKLESFR